MPKKNAPSVWYQEAITQNGSRGLVSWGSVFDILKLQLETIELDPDRHPWSPFKFWRELKPAHLLVRALRLGVIQVQPQNGSDVTTRPSVAVYLDRLLPPRYNSIEFSVRAEQPVISNCATRTPDFRWHIYSPESRLRPQDYATSRKKPNNNDGNREWPTRSNRLYNGINPVLSWLRMMHFCFYEGVRRKGEG